jgi:hypothetical protein
MHSCFHLGHYFILFYLELATPAKRNAGGNINSTDLAVVKGVHSYTPSLFFWMTLFTRAIVGGVSIDALQKIQNNKRIAKFGEMVRERMNNAVER